MRNLILPDNVASVTVFDQTYGRDGVILDVEDHVARAIVEHDSRIREFTPGGADDPRAMPGADDRKVRFLARVGGMDRTELFAAARLLQVSAPATLKTEAIREIVLRHAAAASGDDIPMVLTSRGPDDGTGPVVLQGDDATSLNHGNDSLGQAGRHLTGGTGSTFSQDSLAPVPDPAAQPAPSGTGVVTPTGTQQPPFNQLSTETGRPAHDDRLAAYPISIPPIDPATGKPYAADDPRIPVSALPIQHTSLLPVEQVVDGVRGAPADRPEDGYLDAQEHRAANAIEQAAGELHLAATGQTALSSDEVARRDGVAKQTTLADLEARK